MQIGIDQGNIEEVIIDQAHRFRDSCDWTNKFGAIFS